ncbi:HEAT repeat domain-containing protein [Candidatus Fermentibacteria bacterium]|nr:HEAT repeat domain-containing protein [Candidatus Fermentibacteria bacterium]
MTDRSHTQAPTAGRIVKLLGGIEAARRCAALYPASHPRFSAALESLRETILSLAAGGATLKLTVYKQECFLDELAPEVPVEVPAGFSDRFLRLGLASVEFPADVESRELGVLMRVLAIDTRRMAPQTRLSELASEQGLERITLYPLDYGRLFADGVGAPAEVGERDAEHFARLLTLWDPRPMQKAMSDEEIDVLGRLSEDRAALARLLELSLKGSHPAPAKATTPLAEGTVGTLGLLAERLRNLYPERWESLRKTLVGATLSLDANLVLARRPELLGSALHHKARAPTLADEMDDADLASAIADAVTERGGLDDGLGLVIRDLVPDHDRRVRLEPLLAQELALSGVPETRRSEILTWWEERVVRGVGFLDDVDPLFSSLLAATPPRGDLGVVDGERLRSGMHEEMVLASYLDDLRGLICLSDTPEQVEAVLSHYHTEFVRLAEDDEYAELQRLAEELAGELATRGFRPKEAMAKLLGVTLVDHLARGMLSADPGQRVSARHTAARFGDPGVRAVMKALSRAPEWDICEELRNEIVCQYGQSAEEEVVEWFSDADPRVVREALIIIRLLGSRRGAGKIDALLSHRDQAVRSAALSAMMRIGGSERSRAVERCLRDTSAQVVQIALDAADELGPAQFAGALATLIRGHHENPEFVPVRVGAVRLAGSAKLVALRDTLEEAVRGVGGWTRRARDDQLALAAAKALLSLEDRAGRGFVLQRARWGIGAVRKACRGALEEAKGHHDATTQ